MQHRVVKKSKGYIYSGGNKLSEVANSLDSLRGSNYPAGKKKANELGIYDMTGNVWEWCWDGYDINYYSESPFTDPTGSNVTDYRVIRGGGWSSLDVYGLIKHRHFNDPSCKFYDLGFRVVRRER